MVDDRASAAEDRRAAIRLREQLPQRIFDAHAHLAPLSAGHAGDPVRGGDRGMWLRELGAIMGAARPQGGLMVPHGAVDDPAAGNRWLLHDGGLTVADRALVLAWPDMPPGDLERWLDRDDVIGIHPCAGPGSGSEADAGHAAFCCPEWMWAACQAHGALIMLQGRATRDVMDAEMVAYLTHRCEAYPDARVVLTGLASGSHTTANTLALYEPLACIDNAWFETANTCDPTILRAILEYFGPTRLLWGSGYPLPWQRSPCVSLDNVADPYPLRVDAAQREVQDFSWPAGLESIHAVLAAADQYGLNEEDLKDIFCRNAQRLVGLRPGTEENVQELYFRAKRLMPGGTQLLSKRPEMFAPGQWPAYFVEARGCRVRDPDGRTYTDFSYNGIGSCLLGFRDPDVTRAVRRRLSLGSMCTQNPIEEIQLAERLCELHPWANSVRFGRTGGETAAMAVRIARATTGRSKVAVCGYHGWHDWYLAANLGEDDALRGHLLPGLLPAGVPGELRGTTVTFSYNDRQGFERLLATVGDELACVVMEPARHRAPEPGFLECIRAGTRRHGILLLFDEITIGFRLCVGGSHLHLGCAPDMAFFAKALGNGHPMGAVIGTRDAMDGANESFISSTYWTEGIGPAAALATLAKMQCVNLPQHLAWAGARVKSVWQTCAQATGLPIILERGFPCMAHLAFDDPCPDVLRTLYTQEMLKLGFLASAGYYPTLAHTESDMKHFEVAVGQVFGMLAEWRRNGSLQTHLRGPVAHSGFRRLVL